MGSQLQLGLDRKARRTDLFWADTLTKLRADKRLAQTLELVLTHPDRVIFVDIETTGLSRYYDYITLVGWSLAGKYGSLIRGEREEKFYADLAKAYAVITFNGSNFDLPFLRKNFASCPLPPIHLDLRYFSKRFHLSGGQKAIEAKLGFSRPIDVREIEGVLAPVLWFQYLRGNNQALRNLIRYNCFDIEGMKFILDTLLGRIQYRVAAPGHPPNGIRRVFSLPPQGLRLLEDKVVARRIKSYTGEIARIHLNDLRARVSRTDPGIVGIDLTGSEARPSGWCWFEDGRVETRMIATDEELVSESLKLKPRIVSIDSPLSLPSGRTSVFDDDPGRYQYGITRVCERTLKKRGINVYPALINSMQRLTARGIRLATAFREQGVPVIESYPGAAQDIMGIPRKRASLEMLKAGLIDFGTVGDFQKKDVKHDELDAITASIVGAFFLADLYEALGNEEEDYLIVPDLEARGREITRRMVVGVSGPTSAGKTTVARHLEQLGFAYARYSQTLQRLFDVTSETGSKSSLQQHGQRVREEKGQRWLSTNVYAEVKNAPLVVVDGLRFPEDSAFWFEKYGMSFVHLYINASSEIRRARFAMRGGAIEVFDDTESHPVEEKVPLLRSMADNTIQNDDSLERLYRAVSKVVEARKQKCL